MKATFVFEHYRPVKENDQLLISVTNIDYVTAGLNDLVWIGGICASYGGNGEYKLVTGAISVKQIPLIINDFIFYNKIPQPCNVSLYAIETTDIKYMPVVIREILEHNNLNREPL